MKGVNQIEDLIMAQMEKLNDEEFTSDPDKMEQLIKKSDSIARLAGSFVEINKLKLDVVKTVKDTGKSYERYLGIEAE